MERAKITKKTAKKMGRNFSNHVSKVDIVDLKSTIKENKSDTDLKMEVMRAEATENKSDIEKSIIKSKNDTDLKLKDIE